MSASAPLLVRTFDVGAYRCTLTFRRTDDENIVARGDFTPATPLRFLRQEQADFIAGRDQAVAELSAILGRRCESAT